MYNRKYQPQPVRRVEIPKPNGGTRKLGIPIVLERIIQQAMVQVLAPILWKSFHNIGGVISPVLANLFLHYVYDDFMSKEFPNIPWVRYADDGAV